MAFAWVRKGVRKTALLSHRWTGTAFCLLFLWWFVSGLFLMYFDYPEVTDADRLARAETLDPSHIALPVEEAWMKLGVRGAPDSATVEVFDGRPIYWFRLGNRRTGVYADNGDAQKTFPSALNLRTAAHWAAQAAAAKQEQVTSADQWTVGGIFRRGGQLTKYRWPDGQETYISARTGQVVQSTTRATRLGAWLGPIPHWLYFTPLRENGKLWSKVVIWLSGAATVVAILGLIAGLTLYSPSKRYRSGGVPTSIPFAGTKRLHVILGLFFGFLACTWAFSGMLSMEPFPLERGQGDSSLPEALSGDPFAFEAFQPKSVREALTQASQELKVRRLELKSVAGEPFYLAIEDEQHSRIVPLHGTPQREFDHARLIRIVTRAGRPGTIAETGFLTSYDAYYLDRRGRLPLPVLKVRMNDPQRSIFYIDPRNARITGGYHSGRWMERWLYHGLHSINFPLLYSHRPAWDILVLALMLGGTALCFTSVVIGWRYLRRLSGGLKDSRAVSDRYLLQ